MKEYFMKYKWVLGVLGLIILNIGWMVYNQQAKDRLQIQEIEVAASDTEESPKKEEQVIYEVEEEKIENHEANLDSLEDIKTVSSQEINQTLQEDITKEVPIYICGAVVSPGVYYVPENGIINDVIVCCGGFTAEADKEAINLASPIIANEKIIIPKEGQEIDKIEDSYENRERIETLPSSQMNSQNFEQPSSISSSSLININTATKEQLMTLNGIGEVKAEAIIAYRQEKGGFRSIEEMLEISGIGEKTFEKLKQFITT